MVESVYTISAAYNSAKNVEIMRYVHQDRNRSKSKWLWWYVQDRWNGRDSLFCTYLHFDATLTEGGHST